MYALRLALLSLLAACAQADRLADRSAEVILHPVAENLLSADHQLHSVPQPDEALIAALPFEAAISGAERVFGAAEGTEQEVFGEIVSGGMLATGEVVLLDASFGLVRVLGATGTGAAIGGLGQGPGEFSEPVTLFVHGDSLFVLDRARALHVLAMSGEAIPTYVRAIPLPFEAEDACHMAGGLLALGTPTTSSVGESSALDPSAGTLHRLDGEGRVVESFHVPYRAMSPTVAQAFHSGRLLCSPSDETITVAYSSLGEVHHLTANGEIQWITRLPGYSYPPLREEPDGRVGPSRDFSAPIDQTRHIASLGDSLIVVSVTSTAVMEPGRPQSTRLGVMRKADGAFLGYYMDPNTDETTDDTTSGSIAGLLHGDRNQFLLYRELPYPAVSLRSVR